MSNSNVAVINVNGGTIEFDLSEGKKEIRIKDKNGAVVTKKFSEFSALASTQGLSYTLTSPGGLMSYTLSPDGSGNWKINGAYLDGTVKFDAVTGETKSIDVFIGVKALKSSVGAALSINNNGGVWSGSFDAGITLPQKIAGIDTPKWATDYLFENGFHTSFDPTKDSICKLIPISAAKTACNFFQNGSVLGSINIEEQKLLKITGLSPESSNVFSDGDGGIFASSKVEGGPIAYLDPSNGGFFLDAVDAYGSSAPVRFGLLNAAGEIVAETVSSYYGVTKVNNAEVSFEHFGSPSYAGHYTLLGSSNLVDLADGVNLSVSGSLNNIKMHGDHMITIYSNIVDASADVVDNEDYLTSVAVTEDMTVDNEIVSGGAMGNSYGSMIPSLGLWDGVASVFFDSNSRGLTVEQPKGATESIVEYKDIYSSGGDRYNFALSVNINSASMEFHGFGLSKYSYKDDAQNYLEELYDSEGRKISASVAISGGESYNLNYDPATKNTQYYIRTKDGSIDYRMDDQGYADYFMSADDSQNISVSGNSSAFGLHRYENIHAVDWSQNLMVWKDYAQVGGNAVSIHYFWRHDGINEEGDGPAPVEAYLGMASAVNRIESGNFLPVFEEESLLSLGGFKSEVQHPQVQ